MYLANTFRLLSDLNYYLFAATIILSNSVFQVYIFILAISSIVSTWSESSDLKLISGSRKKKSAKLLSFELWIDEMQRNEPSRAVKLKRKKPERK